MKVYWGAPEAIAAQANPFALLLGDSWFWYPLGNLAVAIGEEMPEHEFVVAGTNGANAGDWDTKLRSSTRFTLKMYAEGVRAFILSGGGNEIAGEDDFLRILAEPEQCRNAQSVEECYEPGQPEGVLAHRQRLLWPGRVAQATDGSGAGPGRSAAAPVHGSSSASWRAAKRASQGARPDAHGADRDRGNHAGGGEDVGERASSHPGRVQATGAQSRRARAAGLAAGAAQACEAEKEEEAVKRLAPARQENREDLHQEGEGGFAQPT